MISIDKYNEDNFIRILYNYASMFVQIQIIINMFQAIPQAISLKFYMVLKLVGSALKFGSCTKMASKLLKIDSKFGTISGGNFSKYVYGVVDVLVF